MKTFGLIVSNGRGWVFDGNVRGLLDGNEGLAKIILPLLEAWRDIRKRAADLDRKLLAAARGSQATKLLMTIPGIGAVTAVSYVAAIEDQKTSKPPANGLNTSPVLSMLCMMTESFRAGDRHRSALEAVISQARLTTWDIGYGQQTQGTGNAAH